MTDCFWCGETYELGVHKRCPNCSTDIDTKSIPIIKKESTCGCGSCGCGK